MKKVREPGPDSTVALLERLGVKTVQEGLRMALSLSGGGVSRDRGARCREGKQFVPCAEPLSFYSGADEGTGGPIGPDGTHGLWLCPVHEGKTWSDRRGSGEAERVVRGRDPSGEHAGEEPAEGAGSSVRLDEARRGADVAGRGAGDRSGREEVLGFRFRMAQALERIAQSGEEREKIMLATCERIASALERIAQADEERIELARVQDKRAEQRGIEVLAEMRKNNAAAERIADVTAPRPEFETEDEDEAAGPET